MKLYLHIYLILYLLRYFLKSNMGVCCNSAGGGRGLNNPDKKPDEI